MMIGTTLNSIIRSDEKPKYAVTSMVVGAILNIILDHIFVFELKWEVKGAATTIISQIVTFIINILYLKKFKSIKLTKESLKLEKQSSTKIITLGISSFITQMSFVLVV